jgi:xanthine dehydrogenase YagS FAD-binding subunit
VAVVKDGSTVKRARVTLGGVAPIPWRVPAVEALLVGKSLDETTIAAACEEALRGAEPLSENGYKIPLTKGLLTRVLRSLA